MEALQLFQEALDRVARNGQREEVDEYGLPGIEAWGQLESRGCVVCVERGKWWILPPPSAR